MEKNRTLRTASGLFILVLLTTCVIGATFAKYTTTGSASDTARVAKWGVEITASGSLYSDAYAKGSNVPAAWADKSDATKVTVAASAAKNNIVAPGTKNYGDGLSFSVKGTPEVAVKVTTSITAEDVYLAKGTYGVLTHVTVNDQESLKETMAANSGKTMYSFQSNAYAKLDQNATYASGSEYYVLTNRVKLDEDYYPVQYKLDGGALGSAVVTAQAMAAKLGSPSTSDTTAYKKTYTVTSKDYAPNTALASSGGPNLGDEKLTWEWPFEKGTDETAKTENNSADTILGDLIAARGATVDYKVVSVGNDDAVTALTISSTGDDYTVKNADNAVVANLYTQFDITLDVTQVD